MSSNFAARFKGMADVPVSSRLPDLRDGDGWFLLDSVDMKDNRDGGYRLAFAYTCLKGLTDGGNVKGDKVGSVIHGKSYFQKEFKQFLFAASGINPEREDELVENLCPKNDNPTLDDAQRHRYVWESALPLMACGRDAEGNKTGAGCFDGQVVLLLHAVTKKGKETAVKGPDGNWVPVPGKPFTNVYFRGNVPLAKVAEELSEADIARFFGSMDKFAQMLADQ
jgi:hypothetical protein